MDEPRDDALVAARTPRRLRLRFGVGGLMLLILVVGLWLGDRVHRARQQRLAVAGVREFGGWVGYADGFAAGPGGMTQGDRLSEPGVGKFTPVQTTLGLVWLWNWLGDEYWRKITFVNMLHGPHLAPNMDGPSADATLLTLQGQSSIQSLQLEGETLTDRGLASVASLTGLEELSLWMGYGITEKGVADLARLPRLRVVFLTSTELSDAAIDHLAGLPALEELTVEGSHFTDQSLQSLAQAKRLRTLELSSETPTITDAGLRHLEGLPNLERVSLSHATISPIARERLLKAIPGLTLDISP